MGDLYPQGGRQKDVVAKMQHYLEKLGLNRDAAEKVALDLWRITRKAD